MIAVRDHLGAYEQFRKEPDLMIGTGAQLHSSFDCCSESYPHLERDMRLWLDGTREVNACFDNKVVPVIEQGLEDLLRHGCETSMGHLQNDSPRYVYFSLWFSSNIILMVCYVRSSSQCDLTNLTLANEDL